MTSCEPCPAFPPENTGLPGQDNDSPVISWSGAPLATKGYAVVLVDLANDLTHWVVYGIPAEATGLPAALPSGDLTGDLSGAHQSSYNGTAYAGSGACNHVYEFRVYALAAALTDTSSRDAIRAELEASEFPVSFVRLRSDFAESCTPHIGAECP